MQTSVADIHLSPDEAARRLGVSTKALRLYERHGLVLPIRAQNGWRAYGPAEMARLHQVLALKGLGLSLKRIAVLLAGRYGGLDAVLELQQEMLERQSERLGRALTLVKTARTRLASGEKLSIDNLTKLTMETTMTTMKNDLETVFKPLIDRHFTESERAGLAARGPAPTDAPAVWQGLMAEAEQLMAIGDPASPASLDLARRWKAMVDSFTGGDPVLAGKVKAVWNEAFSDPNAAPKLPASPATFAFVGEALKNLKAAQNIP